MAIKEVVKTTSRIFQSNGRVLFPWVEPSNAFEQYGHTSRPDFIAVPQWELDPHTRNPYKTWLVMSTKDKLDNLQIHLNGVPPMLDLFRLAFVLENVTRREGLNIQLGYPGQCQLPPVTNSLLKNH